MSLNIAQVGDMKIFDGYKNRCRLDAASIHLNFANGTEEFDLTTDEDGLLPQAGTTVNAHHANVRVTVIKDGYKSVSVKGKITWTGDSGEIGIEAIYMGKK